MATKGESMKCPNCEKERLAGRREGWRAALAFTEEHGITAARVEGSLRAAAPRPETPQCPICRGAGKHPSPAAQAVIVCEDCGGTGKRPHPETPPAPKEST
jgi:hypothetical protein